MCKCVRIAAYGGNNKVNHRALALPVLRETVASIGNFAIMALKCNINESELLPDELIAQQQKQACDMN